MGKDRKIDLVILGLLCHEPLSGYDIKKRIDHSIRFFWKGSFGSIYPALNDMEKTGLIHKEMHLQQSGERERIVYDITESGRIRVEEWLKDSNASNELKYETLLKLFFGGISNCETAIQNIQNFKNEMKSQLQMFKIYQGSLSKVIEENDHLYYYLTVLFGIKTCETYIIWCNEAIKIIEKREKSEQKE